MLIQSLSSKSHPACFFVGFDICTNPSLCQVFGYKSKQVEYVLPRKVPTAQALRSESPLEILFSFEDCLCVAV